MSRLPAVSREALAADEQAIWDRIEAARPGMRGPYAMLMNVPALAARVAAVEDYFRFEAALPAADRELVILATAREAGAGYAWVRHEERGREAGIRAEAVEVVRAHGSLEGLEPPERLLVELARALLRTRTLSDELFARGLAELGPKQLVEVVVLVGHYGLIGSVVNGFAVPTPTGSATF